MDNSLKIIGLVGRAGAGKTTVANHLVANHGFTRIAFADALKIMLIQADMCTYEECYIEKTNQSRWLMQKVGTEIFRKQIHPDFWVQQTAKHVIELLAANKPVVIDDIRFPNEARLVSAYLKSGLLVKLERMTMDGLPYVNENADGNHDSERLVDSIKCDWTIGAESGDVASLIQQMENGFNNWRSE